MPKHPHAEKMLQYAKDAMETDKPWERWEIAYPSSRWHQMSTHPSWSEDHDYRRKPRTITLPQTELPEPMREAPEVGEKYWFLDLRFGRFQQEKWRHNADDIRRLRLRLCHRTGEAAKQWLAWWEKNVAKREG